jgi:octanoyl-[GcvH]:protein N-octanoyltransferase
VIGLGQSAPALRSWVHHDTIVLGTQDSRLPFIEDGISFLKSQGYQAIVRNSGGLAVVLDAGVLNLSLAIKEERHLSIDAGYEAMLHLIKETFKPYTNSIEAKEIIGSYCPGSYDLSIEGRKFAGISQRRIRGGVAVQIYLCISGSGSKRATLIKQFYEEAVKDAETKFEYPHIVPNTMASLSELLGQSLTVGDVMMRTLLTLQHLGGHIEPTSLYDHELALYQQQLERVTVRNERCLMT